MKALAVIALAFAANVSFAADFVQSEFSLNFAHINAREGKTTSHDYYGEVRYDRVGNYCEVFYRTTTYPCSRTTSSDGFTTVVLTKVVFMNLAKDMAAEDYPRMVEILEAGYTGEGSFQFPQLPPDYKTGLVFSNLRSFQDPRSNWEELRIVTSMVSPHYF